MEQYQTLLRKILSEGSRQFNERTGHLMVGLSGHQSIYDLREGFPLVTTKKMFTRGIVEELFWFLRGGRNVRDLLDRDVHIWDANAYDFFLRRHGLKDQIKKHTPEWDKGQKEFIERIKTDDEFARIEGDLGPVYGHQWRNRQTRSGGKIDQVKERVLENLRRDPGTRYAIIDPWDVEDIPNMALAPCHMVYQFNVWENKFLDVNMLQRSCDVYLGVPFNIASAALLNKLIARETGHEAREFIHSYGNVHIYSGVDERTDFLKSDDNFEKFQRKIKSSSKPEDFIEIREWYLKNAPPEREHNQRKDHIPFILEQLSYEPKSLPRLEIDSNLPLFELIEQPASKVYTLNNYDPHKWDSKAEMAA